MSVVQRAYKVEIDPNNKQRTALRCRSAVPRWLCQVGIQLGTLP